MISDIHVSRLALTNSTRQYLERRLSFALGRFDDSVRSVSVALSDVNGPRGGADKRCRILVWLTGVHRPVIVTVTEQTVRAAVDIAAEKLAYAVSRSVSRRTQRRRLLEAFSA